MKQIESIKVGVGGEILSELLKLLVLLPDIFKR